MFFFFVFVFFTNFFFLLHNCTVGPGATHLAHSGNVHGHRQHVWQWSAWPIAATCIVILLPLIPSFSLHMLISLLHSSFIVVHASPYMIQSTDRLQRPYVEGHSQALPVFNLDCLCYQALGLIFCTNTKLLCLKLLTTDLLYLVNSQSSGRLPNSLKTP